MIRVAFRSAMILALSLGLPLVASAGAEEETPLPVEGMLQTIGVDEWRDMVRGKTVTYRIGPDVWAYERYAPRGDGVAIQMADGTCMAGTWYYEDETYCFNWLADLTSCFQHVRAANGKIMVIPVEDGLTIGAVQTVSGISDLVLTCGPTLSS